VRKNIVGKANEVTPGGNEKGYVSILKYYWGEEDFRLKENRFNPSLRTEAYGGAGL